MSDEYSEVLKSIIKLIGDDNLFTISDEEYEKWKENFESMSEHEKVFNLLGALSQYLTNSCKASASVLALAIICTSRWCNEKDMDNF